MPAPNILQIQVPPDLLSAVESHCRKRGKTVAEFGRAALARALGKPHLAGGVRRGRPAKVVE